MVTQSDGYQLMYFLLPDSLLTCRVQWWQPQMGEEYRMSLSLLNEIDRQTDRLLKLLTATCSSETEPPVVSHSASDYSKQLTAVEVAKWYGQQCIPGLHLLCCAPRSQASKVEPIARPFIGIIIQLYENLVSHSSTKPPELWRWSHRDSSKRRYH